MEIAWKSIYILGHGPLYRGPWLGLLYQNLAGLFVSYSLCNMCQMYSKILNKMKFSQYFGRKASLQIHFPSRWINSLISRVKHRADSSTRNVLATTNRSTKPCMMSTLYSIIPGILLYRWPGTLDYKRCSITSGRLVMFLYTIGSKPASSSCQWWGII